MKKRIMTGLLACCLSLSLALPGFAAGSIPAQAAISACPGPSPGPNSSPWP